MVQLIPDESARRSGQMGAEMEGKRKGGASVYVVSVFVLILSIIVWLYTFQTRTINAVRDELDSRLLVSLLGAATINVEEYGRTGQRVIHAAYTGEGDIFGAEENASYPDACLEGALKRLNNLLQTNLKLDGGGQGSRPVIASPVTLEEFKVLNVYDSGEGEQQVYEFIWNNGVWNEVTHGINEAVYVPGAGDRGHATALVEDTTVYAKISFAIELYPFFPGLAEHIPEEARTLSVSMERSVSIRTSTG